MRRHTSVLAWGVIQLSAAIASLPATAQTVIVERASIRERVNLSTGIRALLDSVNPETLRDPDVVQVVSFVRNPYDLTKGKLQAPTWAQLQKAYESLKYLKPPQGNVRNLTTSREALGGAGGVPTKLVGLPSETDIITGIGAYLVDRARDELIVSFLVKTRKLLDSDTVLLSVLSHTRSAVDRIQGMSVSSILPALRGAALEDLDALPVTITERPVLDLDNTLRAKVLTYQTAALSVGVLNALRIGRPPAVAFGALADVSPTRVSNVEARYSMRLLGSVAHEYVTGDGKLTEFLSNTANRRFFVAFLLDDAIQRDSIPPTRLAERIKRFIENHQTDLLILTQQLETTQQQIVSLQARINSADKATLASAIGQSIESAGQVFEATLPFLDDLPDGAMEHKNSLTQVSAGMNLSGAMLGAAAVKDYNRLIVTAVALVREVTDSARMSITSRRFSYLTLVSNLASAKSAEEVRQAMIAGAAPIGSFRAKRGLGPENHATKTIAVNSYLGIAAGVETASEHGILSETAPVVGASAPIGLEWSVGLKAIPSVSVFVPLVDLGTVVSYRIKSSAVSANPKVGLKQILSPGVYAVFGLFKDIPLSVGIGLEYTPSLRSVRENDGTVNALRYGAFTGVDMPLFRF